MLETLLWFFVNHWFLAVFFACVLSSLASVAIAFLIGVLIDRWQERRVAPLANAARGENKTRE